MMRRLFFIIFIFALPLAQAANNNVGTSGAQFLKIGAGARPTAMGDAFVGIADDVNAVYFNPAGLATLARPEIAAMHASYFQDMNYDFGAYAQPSSIGTFGISAATLEIKDFDKRDVNESDLGSFDSLDAAYGLSYGRKLNEALSMGATARYIKQEIDNVSANAWAGDVGVLDRFERLPLSVGVAIRNFGQQIKFNDVGDPLPMIVDVGVGTHLVGDKLLLGLDVKKPRDNDTQFGVGSEWKQKLSGDFKFLLRGGYNSAGTDASGTTGISLGGGLAFRQLDFDVAWVPFGVLGNTMRYTIHVRF